jgi:hypothetical protein
MHCQEASWMSTLAQHPESVSRLKQESLLKPWHDNRFSAVDRSKHSCYNSRHVAGVPRPDKNFT